MMSVLKYWTSSSLRFDLIFIIPVLFVIVRLIQYYFKERITNLPPSHGFIPWLGCAIPFGKAPLTYLESIRKKLGPIFTLKVAGRRLTFVTEVEDFKHFFNSENVDFQAAVQAPVMNTAAVPPESFFEYHTKIHDAVKGRLGPSQLQPFCAKLNSVFGQQIDNWGKKGKADLNDLVRSSMYVAVIENLFGDDTLPTKEGYKELERKFVKFDEDFEYGSQIPEIFLRKWADCKWWLIDIFCKATLTADKKKTPVTEETVFQTLIKTVNWEHAPNYGLLMLWASLANAIPITFWTIAFILTHPDVLTDVRRQLKDVLGSPAKCASDCSITQEQLQQLPLIRWCLLETIRLRSPGTIARGVIKTFQIRGYNIPEGDLLMMSPYWAHRNEKFFPEPEAFRPERWSSTDPDKNLFLDGFIAFGGGRYQCPGRWFALLEIHLYVALVLHQMDFTPKDVLPLNSPLHVVGTQQPMSPFEVEYEKRQL